MKKPTESDLLRACLELLKLHGIFAWRSNQAAVPLANGKGFRRFNGLRGVSDILGIMDDGKFLAIETKSKEGCVSKEQAEFLVNVGNRNAYGLVIRDVRELQTWIDEYKREEES